jgi:hypothetical protein
MPAAQVLDSDEVAIALDDPGRIKDGTDQPQDGESRSMPIFPSGPTSRCYWVCPPRAFLKERDDTLSRKIDRKDD